MSGGQLMAVLIVAIVMIASIVRARYGHGHRRGREQVETANGHRENAQLRDEVKQLKDRIAVLERITVDKENSLERQIEELRDR